MANFRSFSSSQVFLFIYLQNRPWFSVWEKISLLPTRRDAPTCVTEGSPSIYHLDVCLIFYFRSWYQLTLSLKSFWKVCWKSSFHLSSSPFLLMSSTQLSQLWLIDSIVPENPVKSPVSYFASFPFILIYTIRVGCGGMR